MFSCSHLVFKSTIIFYGILMVDLISSQKLSVYFSVYGDMESYIRYHHQTARVSPCSTHVECIDPS